MIELAAIADADGTVPVDKFNAAVAAELAKGDPMNNVPTEITENPQGLLRAIRTFLGECPHDQVANLIRGMDQIRPYQPEPAAAPAPKDAG